MTDESCGADDDAPLARVRRAKAAEVADEPSRGVDGGAVAVGLVVALGAKLAAGLVTLLTPFADVPALASTLVVPVGGYAAGRYAGGGPVRRGVHGVLVATLALALTALGAVAVAWQRALSTFRDTVVANGSDAVLVATALALVVASGVAGVLAERS
ncbi:hypothetical protein [Halomicrococcus gelatinilyticus]|uniref:hypothetical protein n=1 Tax=Halomicrococcus gelatinilyticus TaxID=1702103 RepID=UPI002E141300